MKRLAALLIAGGVWLSAGCGRSPSSSAGDPKAFDRQMQELNREVLRQEGKAGPSNRSPER